MKIEKKLVDIVVSGYTEKLEYNKFRFQSMMDKIFLEFEDSLLELSFFPASAPEIKIDLKKIEQIDCWFDLEEDDIFTTSSILAYLLEDESGYLTSDIWCESVGYIEDGGLSINLIVSEQKKNLLCFPTISGVKFPKPA